MKVFVAGATGAIGKPLVRQLAAAGHEVTGMTRRQERMAQLQEAGAAAVLCDAFDAGSLREAVVAGQPDAVVHLLTALPTRLGPKADLEPTNRLRVEGTRNLVAAAQAAGVRRLVAESVAFFYAPAGGGVKDEEAPLYENAPGRFDGAVKAIAELERQVLEAPGLEGIVLRFGWLYGPGTYFGRDGSQAEEVRKRRFPVIGRGAGIFSFVHVEDAATAIVAALDRGGQGAYNIVDDEPAPLRVWLPEYAEALGAKPPRRAPVWLARLVAGKPAVQNMGELRGATNKKAKHELGWHPRYKSWRQGFYEALG